ncbi:primase [Ruminococcus flavefaciens 007c]|uniref:Signal recognition particle receptor FtsY n=1 Tax=Ruminococcus flavefaciens 007c TaxID=1341157 RepID=W7UZP3_RUMFL|nr:primase [Ruminococcus flavefaciens 007c]
MGLFSKIASGLRKTKDFLFGGIQRVLNSFTVIDEELFDQLEEQMIMSDIGVETSEEICDRLRKKIKERGITDPKEIMGLIHEVISEIMGDDTGLDLTVSPAVIMVIGVNGAGKTTTIGKMCHQFRQEGKKVLVAAADTFRAAAIDQLEVWTQRAGVDIVKHAEGSDPGAVVYDALEAAKARECDVVVIDTAGRLHNKKNLMEELKKINRIIDNKAGDCSREVLLVLDATTGQNAVNQAKLFSETAPITGIVLTKLDGTAKGGIVISIKNELGIPVKLIGVGEKIDDLQPFDSNMFVDALFATPEQIEQLEETEETEEEEYGYDDAGETEDDNTVEVDGVKGYYNEYGAFVAYEDEEEPEYVEEEDYEEESDGEEAETDDEPEDTYDEDTETEDSELTEESDEDSGEDDSDDEEAYDEAEDEEAEEETEAAPEPEKKKKRGFFSRLFGGKDND